MDTSFFTNERKIDPYVDGTWSWCLYPHTEEEIRERVLDDYTNICFSYLAAYSPMSEEFIHELKVLSLVRNTRTLGDVTQMFPVIDRDNYDKALIPVMKTYDWVHSGFKGTPETGGLIYTKLHTNIYRNVKSPAKDIKKEAESYEKLVNDHVFDGNELLKKDLIFCFTDRLPDDEGSYFGHMEELRRNAYER